jgi:hypothetical protein
MDTEMTCICNGQHVGPSLLSDVRGVFKKYQTLFFPA